MTWRHSFRKIYCLDTLDTRFSIPANVPPKHANTELQEIPAIPNLSEERVSKSRPDGAPTQSLPDAKPSLWNTWEFYVYYFVFITCVPMMFKAVYDVSQSTHPSYPAYEHLLSPGWIPGRKVDNSDGQYASVRDNLPYLLLLLTIHPLSRKAYDAFWRTSTYTSVRQSGGGRDDSLTQGLPANAAASIRQEQRLSFDFYFAFILIAALHGFSALKVVLILWLNYKLAKTVPTQYLTFVTWTFNIAILFANEYCQGYRYATVAMALGAGETGETWGHWLDDHGGLLSRWEVLFNLTVLRLISFNLDYKWSLQKRGGDAIEKKQLDPANLSENDRVRTPARPEDYSFRNYIAYALYSPLYLAGPIITFNDYISQCRHQSPTIRTDRTIRYAIRFIVALFCMEVIVQHYLYAVAIFNARPDWNLFTPMQLTMLGYFNLHIIWLKLLIPWRFFRLWALVDGIDPPENMVRCMSNSPSTIKFWRGWHRSYNRWLVRYLFIPLGGSISTGWKGTARSIANYLVIFTFVALWHDINLRLLMWGWLIVLFILPETIGKILFPERRWTGHETSYRIITGIGSVGNVFMMSVANLVGFAIGWDGLKGVLAGIAGTIEGRIFAIVACAAVFTAVQVMFEIREEEKRDGYKIKC
ncbi:hypothetical protein FKW77_002066 [Venturia effusa]|uniref:Glycerol transporter n=1 Tax=Venturia effusa TaxID=50376 RepID=A0A517L6R3_9PEZI|nr:hypothetical protein FKW77_002066 [Venturia effusa]